MQISSLKLNSDFSKVYKRGKSVSNRELVLYFYKNKVELNRVGVSVSSKIGNSVVRHRVKRLIKEALRALNLDLSGYDFVFIARAGSTSLDFHSMSFSVANVFKKMDKVK